MTVGELRAALEGVPDGVDVWVEDECCACSSLADDVMLVPDRETGPVLVITG